MRFNEQWLDQPLRWKKPRRIFVVAHGDLFHENGWPMWIAKIFGVMAACPQHKFQVLTKRPERMLSWMTDPMIPRIVNSCREKFTEYGLSMPWPLPNVWLGTSVENQPTVDRLAYLRETPAAVRWVSFEPLLAPVDISTPRFHVSLPGDPFTPRYLPRLDWVVVGGESGPGYRPMNPEWARSIRDQCKAAGIPFFMKQMAGKAAIPADLMIREYPKVKEMAWPS